MSALAILSVIAAAVLVLGVVMDTARNFYFDRLLTVSECTKVAKTRVHYSR